MTKKDFTAQCLFLQVQVSEDFWRRGDVSFVMFFKAQTEFKRGGFFCLGFGFS